MRITVALACTLWAAGMGVEAKADPHHVVRAAAAEPAARPPAPDGAAATEAAPAIEPADAAPRWPRAVIDRPLTLPAGLVQAGPDVSAARDGAGGTAVVGDVALGVGLTDAVELNTLTPTGAMRFTDFTLAGPWDAGVGVKLLRGAWGGRLEVIARAVAGYDLDTGAARPLRVGVQVQLNVTRRVAVLVHDTGVMPGAALGLAGGAPLAFGLPVGVGVQPTDHVWLEADTNLVTSVGVRGAPTVTLDDVAPFYGTAIASVAGGAVDLLLYAGCGDAHHAVDTAYLGVGARYYAGAR